MKEYNRLAKIIWHIAYHNPGSYGLFWDDDGTMPLKEFLWACNVEPELRVINRDYLNRLTLLGVDLPFTVDGPRLRLIRPKPLYAEVDPPGALYYGASLPSVPLISKKGLIPPSHRSYLGMWDSSENSLLYGKPLEKKVPVRINTVKAKELGVTFLKTDNEGFFLTSQPIPPEAIDIPLLDERTQRKLEERRKRKEEKERRKSEEAGKRVPGVPVPDIAYLKSLYGEDRASEEAETKGREKKDRKRRKGPDWKREARKIRKTKRSL
ncbi:hypothetical protein [Thermodesulforhabdus norvegica]|uniref:Putative RNA 2'-phosphotransferase n=1 Tax=Thermodesulforhabdus norvegica TaxID=39841 RepID=A0A1I4SEX5_9BACT|nr:hypothetical protein [Thermodesulforhabdus norvegica]SFM63012.1 putative RNA 2'-phosphotransferase [Thermodesulforhabdus norvegica]